MDRVPTLALLNVRLDGWYQSQIWHGAAMAARLLGVRLVALVGSAYGDQEQRGGSPGVYELAASGGIDGYLPVVGALSNYLGTAPVQELLDRLPPRPVVCLGMDLPGHVSIVPADGGMEDLAWHLLRGHGIRRFAYIGGPAANPHAKERKTGFLKALGEAGVPQDPRLVFDCDFTPTSAQRAMRTILALKDRPEAVVCANDAMALGVREVIVEHGLRIPDDIVLTGYDDIEEGRTMTPSLTTVNTSIYHMAFRAVEMLVRTLRGSRPESETIPVSVVVRRSCGCRAGATSLSLPRLMVEAAGLPQPARLLETLSDPKSAEAFLTRLEGSFDHSEHAELDHWEQVLLACAGPSTPPPVARAIMEAHAIVSQARHGLDLRRRQALQHLMRDEYLAVQEMFRDLSADALPARLLDKFRRFSDARMRILLFNADLSPLEKPAYGTHPFELEIDTWSGHAGPPSNRELLPQDAADAGARWVTLTISLGTEHYGVVQFREWTSNELILESFRLSLWTILSSARKELREKQAIEELRQISNRDVLTGILNRRGLLEQGDVLVKASMRSGARIGVVLCDLDGLKEINDVHGHADGDLAIKCLARALEDGFRQSDVIGRLGGDEFAVITALGDDGSLEGAIDRVRRALVRRSNELQRPWRARTSAGWMIWDPTDGASLEKAMERADDTLYRDKRDRKSRSHDETSSTIEVWTPPPPAAR